MDTLDESQTTASPGSDSVDSQSSSQSSVSDELVVADLGSASEQAALTRNKGARLVRVLPDVMALDRELVYALPDSIAKDVVVGTIVRVPLNGRRVRGWITETRVKIEDVASSARIADVLSVSSLGPTSEIVQLARWAQERFVGPLAAFLDSASPTNNVMPTKRVVSMPAATQTVGNHYVQVVEVAPASDRLAHIRSAHTGRGTVLVLVPTHAEAYRLVGALRRGGSRALAWTDHYEEGFAPSESTSPRYIVGTRLAVWASIVDLAAIVVLDAHDHLYGEERAPTWNAIEVAQSRAQITGIALKLLTSIPYPGLVGGIDLPTTYASTDMRRQGWAPTVIVDRRLQDPAKGLYPDAVMKFLEGDHKTLVIYNRTGRVRLLQCTSCSTVAACERCGGPVQQDNHGESVDANTANVAGDSTAHAASALAQLRCSRCGFVRPEVCLSCAGQRFKAMRVGATKVAEDLATLLRQPVGLVDSAKDNPGGYRVVVGTEALLRRSDPVDRVLFIDFDQELFGIRIGSDVRAMTLLTLAHRLVGGSRRDGQVMLQTSSTDSAVVRATSMREVSILSDAMATQREVLNLPPYSAIAEISGGLSSTFVASLRELVVRAPLDSALKRIDIAPTGDDTWLVRAPTEGELSRALRSTPRPSTGVGVTGRLRIAVNPVDL